MPTSDLSGRRFGRLVANTSERVGRHTYWNCMCDCGSAHRAWDQHLKRGGIRSCGCLSSETTTRLKTTHGASKSRAYVSWANMLGRCRNPKNRNFAHYGGRGISVCPEWEDFSAFLRDMGHPPTEAHTIERNNVNGNYELNNCRWADRKEQARNTRASKFYSHSGRALTLRAWSEETGVPYGTLRKRLERGLTIEQAITFSRYQQE